VASSVIVIVSVRAVLLAAVVGANVTMIVQLALAATVAVAPVQVPTELVKSALLVPPNATFVICSAVPPVLVSATVCAVLLVPCVALRLTAVGLMETAGAPAAVPVPESTAICGLPAALSVTTNAAVRTPVAVGLKVSETMQLALAAKVAPQLLDAMAKSPALVPPRAMPLMFNIAPPVFPMVTAIGELVDPCAVLGKPIVPLGVKVTTGAFTGVPVPVSDTSCGLPVALSAIERFAVRAPVVVGVKVIDTWQLAFTAKVAVQVFCEMAKSPGLAPVFVMLLRVSVALPVFVIVCTIAVAV
jgi:hypothetical protein